MAVKKVVKASEDEAGQRMCPDCKATVFQGPFERGVIIDGAFDVREQVYQCMGCHAIRPIEDLAPLKA